MIRWSRKAILIRSQNPSVGHSGSADGALGLEDVVGAEVHVRSARGPILHRQLGGLASRSPPVQIPAVGGRKPHRPEEQRALPVDREVQSFGHELAGQLGDEAGRDDVLFAFVLDFDDREVLAILGRRVHPHEILRAWLAHRDRRQELLDPDRLGEGLIEAQVRGIKGIELGGGGSARSFGSRDLLKRKFSHGIVLCLMISKRLRPALPSGVFLFVRIRRSACGVHAAAHSFRTLVEQVTRTMRRQRRVSAQREIG